MKLIFPKIKTNNDYINNKILNFNSKNNQCKYQKTSSSKNVLSLSKIENNKQNGEIEKNHNKIYLSSNDIMESIPNSINNNRNSLKTIKK